MTTDTEIKKFILNVLKKEQYEEAKENGSINPTELYFVDDDQSNSELLPALTFTGAVEATYDGSTPVTVEIPMGGSGGGDNWELILNHEFDEDTGSAEFTADNNGNKFDLKKALIVVKHCSVIKDGTTNGQYLRYNLMNREEAKQNAQAAGDGSLNFGSAGAMVHVVNYGEYTNSADKPVYQVTMVELVDGHHEVIAAYKSQNNSALREVMTPAGGYMSYNVIGLHGQKEIKYITKMNAFNIGGIFESMGKGSAFWLYGIRK